MSTSVGNLMSKDILPKVGISNFNPTIRNKTWNINSVMYELAFPDGTELSIKIEYLNTTINYHFISTTIIRLDMLTDVLTKLMLNLQIYNKTIEQHFIVHIKNNTV